MFYIYFEILDKEMSKYIAWIGVLKHSKMNLVDVWLQIVREIQRWYGFDWQVWWNTNDNNDQVRWKHIWKEHLSYELPYVCESRCQTLQIFSHRIVRHIFFPVYHFLVCLNILIEQITRRLNMRTVYCWWYDCCTSNNFFSRGNCVHSTRSYKKYIHFQTRISCAVDVGYYDISTFRPMLATTTFKPGFWLDDRTATCNKKPC